MSGDAQVALLSSYSPDLSSSEQAFSKLASALRKCAARTMQRLLKLIAKLIRSLGTYKACKRARGAACVCGRTRLAEPWFMRIAFWDTLLAL